MKYHENPEIRTQIDLLLEDNAKRQANLGTESTKTERIEAKKEWKRKLKEIDKLDSEFAELLQPQND